MDLKLEIMNQLKQEILSLTLKPGTIIGETALSERFSLSRTPIRDILKQLASEDYLNIYPKKGNIVSFINLESVEQIIYLRCTLEKEILKELSAHLPLKGIHELKTILTQQKECIEQPDAADRFLQLDDAFHQALFALAGRGFLWDIIQQFNVHYVRYRKLHMLKKDKLVEIQNEHQQMVTYMIERKNDKLDELLNHHLRADINSLYFQEHFAEFIKV